MVAATRPSIIGAKYFNFTFFHLAAGRTLPSSNRTTLFVIFTILSFICKFTLQITRITNKHSNHEKISRKIFGSFSFSWLVNALISPVCFVGYSISRQTIYFLPYQAARKGLYLKKRERECAVSWLSFYGLFGFFGAFLPEFHTLPSSFLSYLDAFFADFFTDFQSFLPCFSGLLFKLL